MASKAPRTPSAVISVVAYEGGGKTHFLASAPKPLTIISTDTNTESVIRDNLGLGEDDVTVCRVNMPTLAFDEREDVKEESEKKFEEVVEFLRPLLKNKADRPRSLGLDTAVDVFDLRVLKEFGKLDQIPPEVRRNMMGRCNTSYKGIIQAFKDVGVNVILIHRAKEKWADRTIRTSSGIKDERYRMEGPFDMEREGFKGTGFITSVEVNLAFSPTREVKDGLSEEAALAARFGMKVVRCTHRPGLIGQEFWGRVKLSDGERIAKPSFPYLMSQIYPHSSIEDWR